MEGPGGLLVAEIEAAFPGTTGPQGVDRARLGGQVFGDAAALARLEAIVHPAVREARQRFLSVHAGAPLIVFDIPLLFEKGGIEEVDRTVVVSAPAAVQRARVLAREGMTTERFTEIIALQMPDSEKRARADYVIDTGRPMVETEAEVRLLVEKLARR